MNDSRLLGRVARLHYENGLTHQEIAQLYELSRVKVTRLLAEARRRGIVEITVHSDARPFAEVEEALARKFDLGGVWVSPPLDDEGSERQPLGLAGAEAIRQLLPNSRRTALGFSASVSESIRRLGKLPIEDLELFPLAGGRAGRTGGSNPQEMVTRMAAATGGTAYQLPAPLVARSAEVCEALLASAGGQEVLSDAARSDLMIVGIGTADVLAPVFVEQVGEDDLAEVTATAAVGDVSARFFDAAGNPVHKGIDERVIGLSLEQMRGIRTRLAIAGGVGKAVAIRAALSSGLINVLATDLGCARMLLTED